MRRSRMHATTATRPLAPYSPREDIMTPWADCTRAQLHACAQHYFKCGGATEPEVALLERDGVRAILKDYGRTPGWFGRWVAPVLIAREASALTQLDDLAGVPRLYRRIDRRALLMECMPATRWARAQPSDDSYAQLADLIAAMHARGVAHCDLRAPSNILLDADGHPCIVDFVARVRRGARWNVVWNALFERFCAADASALTKLKRRYAPHLLSAQESAATGQRGVLERIARGLGSSVRRVTRLFVGSDRS